MGNSGRGLIARAWLAGCLVLGAAACSEAYPEVVVVNRTDARVLLRNPSFNGCLWDVVLAYGEATYPGRCLPGMDRVHFGKLDAGKYCSEQVGDDAIAGACECDEGTPERAGPSDPGLVDPEPRWFNYQTRSEHEASYGDFVVIDVDAEDLEQDFAVPGPYGH